MKNIKNVLILLSGMVLFGCNKSENKRSFITSPLITKSFITGTWHITGISKHHKDEKNIFDSCFFKFTDKNRIIVTEGSHTYSGMWTVISDRGTDDCPAIDIAFKITFEKGKLSELNEDWRIDGRSLSQLSLKDDADRQDYLVFEKF